MRVKNLLWTAAGFLLLALGMIGLVIPVWPTTPFVLGAAGCFSGSPKLRAKIARVPFFKEYIQNYEKRSGISKKTVMQSLLFLWGMLSVSAIITKKVWLACLLLVIGIVVTIHIVWIARPEDERHMKRIPDIMEFVFDILYLTTVMMLGCYLLFFAETTEKQLYGLMALVLGTGDSFHLIPRLITIWTGDRERFAKQLGYGKLITSISMTLFYVLLWHIGIRLYSLHGMQGLTALLYGFAIARIGLCLCPQNQWTKKDAPVKWNIYRNVPFILLGGMVLILYFLNGTGGFRWMWLAITLSFACYIPVVVKASENPKLGMLMLPKSCAYIWIVCMGLSLS